MELFVDWPNLVDSEKKLFKLKEGLNFPTFAFEGRLSMNEQKINREHIINIKD